MCFHAGGSWLWDPSCSMVPLLFIICQPNNEAKIATWVVLHFSLSVTLRELGGRHKRKHKYSSVVSFLFFSVLAWWLRCHAKNMKRARGMAGSSVDRWSVQLRRTRRSPGRMDESSFHQLFPSQHALQNPTRSIFVIVDPTEMLCYDGQIIRWPHDEAMLNLDAGLQVPSEASLNPPPKKKLWMVKYLWGR